MYVCSIHNLSVALPTVLAFLPTYNDQNLLHSTVTQPFANARVAPSVLLYTPTATKKVESLKAPVLKGSLQI